MKKGDVLFIDNSINVINGKDGIGKSSLLKNLFKKYHVSEDICFQLQHNDHIINELSVLENISMSFDKEINQQISEDLKKYDFDYLLKLNTKKMSGGEKRMVQVFRILYSPCKTLFIDEPTNDISYNIVEKLLDFIKLKANNRKVIIITHDNRVNRIGDQFYIIENNKIRNTNDNISASNQTEYESIKIEKDLSLLKKHWMVNYFCKRTN